MGGQTGYPPGRSTPWARGTALSRAQPFRPRDIRGPAGGRTACRCRRSAGRKIRPRPCRCRRIRRSRGSLGRGMSARARSLDGAPLLNSCSLPRGFPPWLRMSDRRGAEPGLRGKRFVRQRSRVGRREGGARSHQSLISRRWVDADGLGFRCDPARGRGRAGGRTRTSREGQRILNPRCLPIPPLAPRLEAAT